MERSERTKERDVLYRAAHREDARKRSREWRERNPLRATALARAGKANATAAQFGAEGRLTADDILELWERQPVCVRCGTGRGVDHIVGFADGGANVTENIQTMCYPCNVMKEAEAKKVRPRKPFCVRGHPRTEANLWFNAKTGYTDCRLCQNIRDRKRRGHHGTAAIVVG